MKAINPRSYFIVAFLLTFTTNRTLCQIIPFDSERWVVNARESKLVQYEGKHSLYMKGGIAYVKDSEVTNGVIEFDIAFSAERSFVGAVWRLQDLKNYEQFYMRPHQSGNPDANQYTPVFHGVSGWQLYHGVGYGSPVEYRFNKWMHTKIVISEKRAEVYLIDMEKPMLFIPELKRDIVSGKVGLSAGNFAPAYFSNFQFSPVENAALRSLAQKPQNAPTGTIRSWNVSNPFVEKSLEDATKLTKIHKENLTWKKLNCESTGLANLARLQGVEDDKNTVFARLTVVAESSMVKQMTFGFSDRVKIYLNDQLIYGGDNSYRSRDYRFLGTIGFFDQLYLPLIKGDNEIWMAVSEDFGGWGLIARFKDVTGMKVKEAPVK